MPTLFIYIVLLYILITSYELHQFRHFYQHIILQDERNAKAVDDYLPNLMGVIYLSLLVFIGMTIGVLIALPEAFDATFARHNVARRFELLRSIAWFYGGCCAVMYICCFVLGASMETIEQPLTVSKLISAIIYAPTLLFCCHLSFILTAIVFIPSNTNFIHEIYLVFAIALWIPSYLLVLDWQSIWQMWPFAHMIICNGIGVVEILHTWIRNYKRHPIKNSAIQS